MEIKDIFILGHNSKREADIAYSLERSLVPLDLNTKLSVGIKIGINTEKYISDGIENCDILIVLLSENFLSDTYKIYEDKIKLEDKIIIPVIINGCLWKSTKFEPLRKIEYSKFKGGSSYANQYIGETIESYKLGCRTVVSAGLGTGLNDNIKIISDDITFSKWRFLVKGDSMKNYFDGDTISAEHLLYNSFQSDIQINEQQDYVIEIEDEGLFLKNLVLDIANDKITLKSSNKDYKDRVIYGLDKIKNIWKAKRLIDRNLDKSK